MYDVDNIMCSVTGKVSRNRGVVSMQNRCSLWKHFYK